MKKIIIISLFFFTSCCRMIAQPPAPGTNVVNNYINKFEGTWQWVNGNDTLIVKLKKVNTSFGDYSKDVLLGVHKYIKNGQIINDVLNKYDSLVAYYKKSSILLSQHSWTDTLKVVGSINDYTKKKINRLELEYLGGTPVKIAWRLEVAEGSYINPDFQYGLTMPENVVLTKQ